MNSEPNDPARPTMLSPYEILVSGLAALARLAEAFLSLSRSGYAASRSFDGVNRTSNSNEPTSEFGPEADIGALT
jgi:hypothetical protein